MEKKAKKPWSDGARARHKAGVKRYQEHLKEWNYFRGWCEVARTIGVDVKSLVFAVNATSKTKFREMCGIEPQEERLRVFKDLVIDYCQGVTP